MAYAKKATRQYHVSKKHVSSKHVSMKSGRNTPVAFEFAAHRASTSPDWRDFLEQRVKTYLAEDPAFKPLMNKLLAVGGDYVAPQYEPDLAELLERGELQDPKRVVQHLGNECRCHENVAWDWLNWRGESGRLKISTGWALSKDGIWRQHSWLVLDDEITETTKSKREKYWGIILDDLSAEQFAKTYV